MFDIGISRMVSAILTLVSWRIDFKFYFVTVVISLLISLAVQLFISFRSRVKKNFIYRLIIMTITITAIVSIGNYIYQINILGIGDEVRNQINRRQRFNEKKTLNHDNTSILNVQKMVMRDAAKGLEKQGFVAIPSQNILLPIYNDAYSEQGLNAGANYANRSAVDPEGSKVPIMGQGNYGLAAHNFNDGHTGFSALQQSTNHDSPYLVNGQLKGSSWLNGKTILMANNKGIYRYVITGQTAVSSSQVSVLNPTRQPELTIISCLFPSTDFRVITRAKLRTTYTWRQAPSKYVSEFNLKVRNTNAHVDWWNPGVEEGANGDQGGLKK